MRPPMAEMRAMIAATASRHPNPVGTLNCANSRYITRFAIARTPIGSGIIRFRQLRAAMISRAARAQRAMGKARSTAALSQSGSAAEIRQTMRPSSQSATSPISRAPRIGGRPVQVGIAVSMKPAMAAGTKPNSIAWMCHVNGSKRLGKVAPVTKRAIHRASASAAQTAAARKKGRNARDHRAAARSCAEARVAIATTHLAVAARRPAPGADSAVSWTHDTSQTAVRVCAGANPLWTLPPQSVPSSAIRKICVGWRIVRC